MQVKRFIHNDASDEKIDIEGRINNWLSSCDSCEDIVITNIHDIKTISNRFEGEMGMPAYTYELFVFYKRK